VSRSTIALPFHNNLKEDEIQYVVENLKDIIYSL
jgi:dTDP-4-amino-4,6-dideoxygalactose transaminase